MRGERRAAVAAGAMTVLATAAGGCVVVVRRPPLAYGGVAAAGAVRALLGAWAAAGATRGALRRVTRHLAIYRAGDVPAAPTVRGAEGEALDELAHWAAQWRDERRGVQESLNLARLALDALPDAVLLLDDERIVSGNPAAAAVLGTTPERLPGSDAAAWEIGAWLTGDAPRWIERRSKGAPGQWELRRYAIERGGRTLIALVLSDRTPLVRQVERRAWERMLAALRGSDGVPFAAARRDPRPLTPPAPRREALDAAQWIPRVAACFPQVRVVPGPPATTLGDATQLADALAEILANAVDATADTGAIARVAWRRTGEWLEILVEDEGDGLPRDLDVFAPCVTTRGDRAGFGLAVARARIEAAGGSLTVLPRPGDRGTLARVRIPLLHETAGAAPREGAPAR